MFIFKIASLQLISALAAVAVADPSYYGYGPALAYHPAPYGHYGYGAATSYEYRSPQGAHGYGWRGKREAEPSHYGYGYPAYHSYAPVYGPALAWHPYGATSYEYRSPQGLRGKREAEADADAHSGSYQHVSRYLGPYGGVSDYSVHTNGYHGAVHETRIAPAYPHFAYSPYAYFG